jgi:hypothetical protein
MQATSRKMLLKVLLACGIVSSAVYIGSDIAGALMYPGYSFAGQAFSELLAIGSPVRQFMIATANVYNLLVIAFGVGVVLVAGAKRSLRITGFLLVFYGVVSGLGPYIPMHVRGTTTLVADLPHILITAATVLAILLFLGFGSASRGRGFMIYSIATIAAVVAGGVLAGQQAGLVAAGSQSPFLGLIERLNIYATMLWIAVLSVLMLLDVRASRAELRSRANGLSGERMSIA